MSSLDRLTVLGAGMLGGRIAWLERPDFLAVLDASAVSDLVALKSPRTEAL